MFARHPDSGTQERPGGPDPPHGKRPQMIPMGAGRGTFSSLENKILPIRLGHLSF